MDLSKVTKEEILYRVVKKSQPDCFIDGVPTAALFMDGSGVSVDRDGGRDEGKIIKSLERRFTKRKDDYKTSVKVGAGDCFSIGTYPMATGNKKNKYHAEIRESEDEIAISLKKAFLLASRCKEVTE